MGLFQYKIHSSPRYKRKIEIPKLEDSLWDVTTSLISPLFSIVLSSTGRK
jgi:hypothetical protein